MNRLLAHLTTTGWGPFYDGVAHFALTPEDLLAVVAMALLAGLLGKRHGRAVFWILPLAWLAGGFAGLAIGHAERLSIAGTVALFATGSMVALDRRIPYAIAASLAAALGLLHGFLNGSELRGGAGGQGELAGIGLAVWVVATLAMAATLSLRSARARVAVRVAGSWIVAIGMLMLGWALHS